MAGDPLAIIIGIGIDQLIIVFIDVAAVETAACKSPKHIFGILIRCADHTDPVSVGFHAVVFHSDDIVDLFASDVVMIEIAHRNIADPAGRDLDAFHADIRMVEVFRRVSDRNAGIRIVCHDLAIEEDQVSAVLAVESDRRYGCPRMNVIPLIEAACDHGVHAGIR